MCKFYSYTMPQGAARELARVARDIAGNIPPPPAVFPNMKAPVVRIASDGVRKLLMMRAGPFHRPSSQTASRVRKTDRRYLQPWLKKSEQRCLVPVTSFAEPDNGQGPVLLLDQDAREMWMNAPGEIALLLQRPPPAGALKVVAVDTKQDSGT
jgi:putative SOS response-associated peptidase YedK